MEHQWNINNKHRPHIPKVSAVVSIRHWDIWERAWHSLAWLEGSQKSGYPNYIQLWYPHAIPIIDGYKWWYLMGIAWGSNISSEWNWSWPHCDAFHWNGNGIRGRNKPNSFMIAAIFSLVNYYNSARRNPKIWSLEWWELDWGNYPQAAELFRLVNCEILSRKMGDGSFWSFSHLNQLW